MIIKNSLDQAWFDALHYLLEQGKPLRYKNRREILEVMHLVITIQHDKKAFERIFSLLQHYFPYYIPSKEEMVNFILSPSLIPGFRYSYGNRIFHYKNQFNQVHNFILPLLRNNPTSKRAIISLWDPKIDAKARKVDAPSLIAIECKIRDNFLHLSGITRSLEMLFGWPAHIYQLSVLQDYLFKELKKDMPLLQKGNITTITLSALLFGDEKPQAEKLLHDQEYEQ